MYKGYCITEETINDVTLPYFNENRMRKQAYEDALVSTQLLFGGCKI